VAAGLVLVGLAFLSCVYQPEVPDGVLRCDEYQRCPAGYICNATRNGDIVALVCCRTIGCEDRLGTGPRTSEPDADLDTSPDSGAAELPRAPDAPPNDGPFDGGAGERPDARD
jgi:hypothetical protein